jgi:hypothetical protein
MKLLLILTALSEVLVGAVMLIVPWALVSVLLGVELQTPVGDIVARVAGAALVSLAIACWQLRGSGGIGIVVAVLFYNVSVNTVFVYAAVAVGLQGPLLWPAIVAHYALAAWCVVLLWFAKRHGSNPEVSEAEEP